MSTKEQDIKIEAMNKINEATRQIYKVAYNEAIEDVLANMNCDNFELGKTVRKLKK